MSQSRDDRIAALESLLPLVEAHLDTRITAKPGWVSPPEVRPPGWVPPEPEPDCEGRCVSCSEFGPDCTLRQERWKAEWDDLRKRYPLETIERLLSHLAWEQPAWHSALYWTVMQPWDGYERERRHVRAQLALGWLADEWGRCGLGVVPTYVPKGMPIPGRPPTVAGNLKAIAQELRAQGKSFRAIGRELHVPKSTVHRVLRRSGCGSSTPPTLT